MKFRDENRRAILLDDGRQIPVDPDNVDYQAIIASGQPIDRYAVSNEDRAQAIKARCDELRETQLQGKMLSLLVEAARLLYKKVSGAALTAPETDDAALIQSVKQWDFDMVAAQTIALSSTVAPADIAWPKLPNGVTDAWLAGF